MGGGGGGNEAVAATKAAKKVGCSTRVDPCYATSPSSPSLPLLSPPHSAHPMLLYPPFLPLCSPPVPTPLLPPPFTPSPLSFPFPAFRGCCPPRIGCPQRMGRRPALHPCTATPVLPPPCCMLYRALIMLACTLPSPPVRHVAGGLPPERTKSYGLFEG